MPPAPNPNAIRQNARVGPLVLPSNGRGGAPAPACLLESPTDQELSMWERLWTEQPQAVAWENLKMFDEVARYVRLWLKATKPDAPAALASPTTSLANQIGLTPQGMRMLMWTVGPAKSNVDSPHETATVTDIRNRLKAVS